MFHGTSVSKSNIQIQGFYPKLSASKSGGGAQESVVSQAPLVCLMLLEFVLETAELPGQLSAYHCSKLDN